MKKIYEFKINHLLLIASFITLFLATRLFFIGFHSVDLVYNYQNLALQMNPRLQEANLTLAGVDEAMDSMSRGKAMYLSDLYIKGNNQKIMGLNLMFFSGLLFALALTVKEKEIKK